MYLNKLYRYNKKGFYIFLLVLMAFIVINYKQGAVATPLYLYGMYSGPRHSPDTQKIYQLSVNGLQLVINDIPFAERDLLLLSPVNYQLQKKLNPAVSQSMSRLFSKAGIGDLLQSNRFINSITDADFNEWYMNIAGKITGLPVQQLDLQSRCFVWKNDQLMPVGEPVNELTIAIKQ